MGVAKVQNLIPCSNKKHAPGVRNLILSSERVNGTRVHFFGTRWMPARASAPFRLILRHNILQCTNILFHIVLIPAWLHDRPKPHSNAPTWSTTILSHPSHPCAKTTAPRRSVAERTRGNRRAPLRARRTCVRPRHTQPKSQSTNKVAIHTSH